MSCRHCEGKGLIAEAGLSGFMRPTTTKLRWIKCKECSGRGELPDDDEAEAARRGFHIAADDDDDVTL